MAYTLKDETDRELYQFIRGLSLENFKRLQDDLEYCKRNFPDFFAASYTPLYSGSKNAIFSMAVGMSHSGFILNVLKPYVLKNMKDNGITATWDFIPTSGKSLTGNGKSEERSWGVDFKYGRVSINVVFEEDAGGNLSVFINGDFVTSAKNGTAAGFDYKKFMCMLLGGKS